MEPSRKKFLKIFLAGSAVLIGGGAAALAWIDNKFNPNTELAYAYPDMPEGLSTLSPTPACDDGDHDETATNSEGPFYTPETPMRSNLRESGITGTPLVIAGQVLTTSCIPVAGAVLDFWSCDGNGDYDNEGFKLRGHQYTDSDGRFRLETVKPAGYGQFLLTRTPHIHVKVQGKNTNLLTTQLYFPGEERNKNDMLFEESLTIAIDDSDPATLNGRFDFVLA